MAEEIRTVSRQELYDQVWSEPMTKLAPRFGLSDVGLAKVCKKYEIPRPPVGYWAKLEHGKKVPRPALPELTDVDLKEIRFFRKAFENNVLAEPEKESLPEIIVKDDLRRLHPLVQQAKDKLYAEDSSYRGLLNYRLGSCVVISVSKTSLSRSLRIFDALIRYWESVQGTVKAEANGLVFAREADGVPVSISEKITRKEKPNQSRYYKDYTYEPTGNLTLCIDGWSDGLRKNWSDGKTQQLESLLGKVALTLEKWVVAKLEQRIERECVERQQLAASAIRDLRKEELKTESERVKMLDSSVAQWVRATQIRGYLAELEARIEAKKVAPTHPEEFIKWQKWAHWYADSICPITPTPSRPLVDEPIVPRNLQIADLDITQSMRRSLEKGQVKDTDELAKLSRQRLNELCEDRYGNLYNDVTRVLEGLGYDINARSRW